MALLVYAHIVHVALGKAMFGDGAVGMDTGTSELRRSLKEPETVGRVESVEGEVTVRGLEEAVHGEGREENLRTEGVGNTEEVEDGRVVRKESVREGGKLGMMAIAVPLEELIFEGLEDVDTSEMSSPEARGGGVDHEFQSSVYNASFLVSEVGRRDEFEKEVCEVVSGIYLGAAKDGERADKLDVNYILDLAGGNFETTEITKGKHKVLKVAAEDRRGYRLLGEHFETCRKFISEGIENGNVLVHCQAGVNRSVAVVAAYLISELGFTLSEALRLLRQKRGVVLTNTTFLTELVTLASEQGVLDI